METCCWKVKLKPGSIDRVRQWVREVTGRKAEYLEAIEAERSFVEALFLDSNESGDFIIFYHKAENIDQALEYFFKSDKPIDVHKQRFIKDAWERYDRLEFLFEAEVPKQK